MENVTEPILSADQSDTSSSGLWQGLQSPLTFGLVLCGGVGAVLFTATYLLEGITQPGYDAWQQAIATLSLGPGGWVQQVNFVVYGILLLLSAVGWYRLLRPERAALPFPLLQGIGGLGLIGVGVFTSGTLHITLAYLLIIALAMGCFTLATHFARVLQWRGWAVSSVMAGVLMLVFWGMFIQGANGNVAGLTPVAGLVERLSAGSHDLWMCALLVMLFFQQRRQRLQGSEEALIG